MPIREKTIVPLLISDYIVALPTAIAYDQKRVLVSSMATLTHSVTFHSDNYDVIFTIKYHYSKFCIFSLMATF